MCVQPTCYPKPTKTIPRPLPWFFLNFIYYYCYFITLAVYDVSMIQAVTSAMQTNQENYAHLFFSWSLPCGPTVQISLLVRFVRQVTLVSFLYIHL
jgi:hypothetical protein